MAQPIIAVVDDDAQVRAAAASLIRAFGYRTCMFESAEAFLGDAPGEAACVLTDLHMPGRSGLELRAALRDQGAAVPMILMTAFATADLRAQAATQDWVALLDKPLDADRLEAALGAALSC